MNQETNPGTQETQLEKTSEPGPRSVAGDTTGKDSQGSRDSVSDKGSMVALLDLSITMLLYLYSCVFLYISGPVQGMG